MWYIVVMENNIISAEPLTPKEIRMEKAGATREAAYKAVVDGLSAEVMTLDKYGAEHTAPDNSTRIRSAEMILKMRGDIKPENSVDARVYNTQINITPEELKVFSGIVNSMKEEIKNLRGSGRQTGEIIDVSVA